MKPVSLAWRAIIVSALAAFLLWHFGRELFGHTEAWDGDATRYLLCMLALGGLVQLVFPAPPRDIYCAAAIGALAGAALKTGFQDLNPLGGVFMFIYALPVLLGAWGVQRVRRR